MSAIPCELAILLAVAAGAAFPKVARSAARRVVGPDPKEVDPDDSNGGRL